MIESQKSKVESRKTSVFRYIGISIAMLCSVIAFAQSNLTYELKVGATGDVQVLKAFPESYAGEKVNVKVKLSAFSFQPSDFDFVFVNEGPVEGFDSIYSFTDAAQVRWTVWRSKKEPKNRTQRVLVVNGRNAFEQYLHETTGSHRSHAWIWWVLAGLLGTGIACYSCFIIIQRRKEKSLSSVEQEMLRRKRMGNRRHYWSQAYLWLLLLVLYAPIALIAVFSFTESKVLGNWTGFSFQLYTNLFTGHAGTGLNSAIWYTVIIALVAAA